MITSQTTRRVDLFDLHPTPSDFMNDVISGLGRPDKRLPSMYFYDERGSALFDEICELPEYYPTRTEINILRRNAAELSRAVGERCMLIELGSGSSDKTRILLQQLRSLHSYVPVDISKEHLCGAAARIDRAFPELSVHPVCADFMTELRLPPVREPARSKLVFFPGSTIGNFPPKERRALLERVARLCHPNGSLLIGIDLKKDVGFLERAYNDSQGVTSDFNLNLLRRINRELGADFDIDAFEHRAVYDENHGRIEMHLVSRASQVVHLGQQCFHFDVGESICTEYSYKFTTSSFVEEARLSGFRGERIFTDPERLFAVALLSVRARSVS